VLFLHFCVPSVDHRRIVLSKPVTPKIFFTAVCIVAVTVVAAAALLAVAPAKSSGRLRRAAVSTAAAKSQAVTPAEHASIDAAYAALPLAFEANQGQVDPQVKYMARGNGYKLFLTDSDAVFSFHSKSSASEPATHGRVSQLRARTIPSPHSPQKDSFSVVRMRLLDANSQAQIAAAGELPGKTNYYLGNDPKNWHTNVPQYGRVSYKSVYPGIDLAYYGERSRLEFDFIVAPESNPAPIDLSFSGAQHVATDASGNLIVSSTAGDVVLHKPVAYQQQDGARQLVDASFVLKAKNQVTFELGNYDHSRELVIDPSVTYATYLGGSAVDEAYAIAVDAAGNSYITGATDSPNFPGGLVAGSNLAAFVSALNPAGTAIIFSTFIGGNSGTGDNSGFGIAVNSTGTYIIGNTASSTASFPAFLTIGPGGGTDVFVAKLNSATGTVSQLTRIGGSGNDTGNGIAIDSTGAAYIGGQTDSTDFPLAGPSIQTTNPEMFDGFVAKLDTNGTVLDYSTYLGGATAGSLVTGIGIDGSNNAYVTGITVASDFPTTAGALMTKAPGTEDNGFVTSIKADGSAMIYSTYLGGSGSNDAFGIAVDSAGEAFITGDTNSTDFPTVNPAQASLKGATDVFVSKLNASGSALLFSTYFGGTLADTGTGIALDSFNDVYVTGQTFSSDYPVPGSPFQSSLSGTSDAFVTELSNTGFTVYSSYLGGTGDENSVLSSSNPTPLGAVAIDSASNAYLAGSTDSTTGFPISSSAVFQPAYGGDPDDAFVAKIGAAPAGFSVAVSPASISTTSGQTTATITVTVSSVNAPFGSAVTLSCGGAPSNAVCNFSAASVTPGSSPATSNLTISTNGAAAAMLTPAAGHHSNLLYAMLLPFGGIAIVGTACSSKRKRFFSLTALALTLAFLLILPACGGSSGGSSGGGGGGGGGGSTNTPPGTYTVTVSGASGGVTESAPVTLTVN
jgi:hypothetical protein